MNKEQFKACTKNSATDPRTIVRLMKLIYESDISDFFHKNMWASGNPFFEVYNDYLNRKDCYSETSEERIAYKKIIKDLNDFEGYYREIREDLIHYLSYGSYMYSSPNYIRNDNSNN